MTKDASGKTKAPARRRLTAEDRAFLATYDLSKYDRPSVTADVVAVTASDAPAGRGRAKKKTFALLLVKRGRPPFKGMWALPGGFLNRGESLEQCARRELREETGVEACGPLVPLAPRSEPGRDPRGWIVSCPHFCVVEPGAAAVRAADDAAEAKWFPLDALPPLAFDHSEILLGFRETLGRALAARASRGAAETGNGKHPASYGAKRRRTAEREKKE